jgi:hypothetical protein
MTQSSSDSAVAAITSTDLMLPVRNVLTSPDAVVTDWRDEVLQGGAGFIGSTYRFAGTADDRGQSVPWSLVLKLIRGDPSEAPSDFGYWKREAEAYQSGALDQLAAGVRAPCCHGCVVTDDLAWLWLEDVRDDFGTDWPLDHYGVVARHLGRLSGTHVRDEALLGQPWLSAGWLAAWVDRVEPVMASFRTAIERDVFARFWNASVAESVMQLWDARSALLDALAELPQTFCHLDAFRRNIIPSRSDSGDMESVLLDWAFAGTGALGEELAPLTIASVVFDPAADSEVLPELDDVAFRGYLDGLADVGWTGKRDEVRFVYATAAALRYLVGVTGFVLCDTDDRGHFVAGEGWADRTNQIEAEAMLGRPFDDLVDHLAGVFEWVASLGDEAFQLQALIQGGPAP